MSEITGQHTDVLTAVRCLNRGQRDRAMRLLTRSYAEDPADFRITHALALMSLWQLVSGRAGTVADWRLCLGLWANLLAEPRFWTWFATEAGHRYRAAVPAGHVDAAREKLEQWLSQTVARCAGDDLAVALALEVRAAKLVAVRGGVSAPTAHRPIPCGPMLIRHLALDEECHRLTAGLLASLDEQTRRAAMYFSRLGMAVVHLDRDAPTAALACLAEVWCADCERHAGRLGAAPRLCREGCPSFAELNPAYARVNAGQMRFLVAACTLTVEAHLRIAETALSSMDLDVPTAREHWRAAVELPGSAELVRQHVTGFALPRVRFLQRSRRRDDAIAVLQALPLDVEAAGDEVFGEATRSLGQLLAARGVEFASRTPPEFARAQADLRQAVKLCPTSWNACRNLVVVLQNAAGLVIDKQRPLGTDFYSATTLLTEAREHVTAFPGGGKREEVDVLLRSISRALGMTWNAQAVRAHERGDHDEALRIIDRALAELPGDSTVLHNRRVISDTMRLPQLSDSLGDIDLSELTRLLGRAGSPYPRGSRGVGYQDEFRYPEPEPRRPSGGRFRRAWRALVDFVMDLILEAGRRA
ncbi:hypothetical protein [Actinocrispum wychmicini]|uniref:Tetratricopeptide repeat protein n=1 Tax=Actinocrispum wychmicini TaxID=1213861 RepID=A0A4R2JRL7_9PSEU|nr:hypothetical protein [Actinocrispum wychmicini]TCO62174.1 hypothetical protein EV192_102311 [Actinocrispum wychmicini]